MLRDLAYCRHSQLEYTVARPAVRDVVSKRESTGSEGSLLRLRHVEIDSRMMARSLSVGLAL